MRTDLHLPCIPSLRAFSIQQAPILTSAIPASDLSCLSPEVPCSFASDAECPQRWSRFSRRELINHTLPPIVSAPNFVMRNRKTSLTYRLLRRHQNYIIVCIYLCGQFLKTRKVAHNENENLFEHKTPCPGFTSKCLSNAQTAFRFSGLTILC